MLQATFCPFVESSIPLIQVWRGFELDVDFSREGFVERILYCRTLFLGQVKRAAHEGGFGGCFKGLAEARFRWAVQGLASV